jgi:hypothetical protein
MKAECIIYTYSEMLFSLKKKEILPYARTWMNAEDIIQSESFVTKTNMA